MLPGFKALLATAFLAVAIVTFGFGAAAVLRVAHEDFATLPAWRTAMEPMADTVARIDTETPVLAALRIEPEPETAEPVMPMRSPLPEPPVLIPLPEITTILNPAPAPPQPVAVVAALPLAPAIDVPDAPYNAPRVGPLLMPEVATNDAPPVATVSLAPAESATEPLEFAPLPRPKPAIRPKAVKRPVQRRAATPVAKQAPGPFEQLFGSAN